MSSQCVATSKDGTRCPYFVVCAEGREAPTATIPTLLYGYGGFEISMTPVLLRRHRRGVARRRAASACSPTSAAAASSGPTWHQAAVKANKQQQLRRLHRRGRGPDRARKSRSPRHLGIKGGSNGGLLVGAVMVAAARAVQRGRLPGAAARHEALQQAARGRLVDGRVRRPRRSRPTGPSSRSTARTRT